MKTMKFLTVAILSIFIFTSCSKDDSADVQEPQPPQSGSPINFSYNTPQVDIAFYSAGSISAPNVDWNGETGTFSLQGTYQGVTINSTTGILSFNKELPLGETVVNVKAENSHGFTTAQVELKHSFEGNFAGGWNNDPTSPVLTNFGLLMNFNADGTMTVNASGDIGSGSWYLIPNGGNGQIKATFTFDGSAIAYSFYGDVTYSGAITPVMEGPYRPVGAPTNQGIMYLEVI